MSKITTTVHIPAEVAVEHWVTHEQTHPEAPTHSSWRLGGLGGPNDLYLSGTPEEVEALAHRLLAAVADFRERAAAKAVA